MNLRRIASSADREQSRYGDLLKLARWFDGADDDTAHALWAAAFGLYSCRHLGMTAETDDEPVPPATSWWHGPVADVPLSLRQYGNRTAKGRAGSRADFSAAKQARVAEREAAEQERREALAELSRHPGPLGSTRLSDQARTALLDLYSRALTGHGRPLTGDAEAAASAGGIRVTVRRTPGQSTVIASPAGRMELVGLSVAIVPTAAWAGAVAAGQRGEVSA
jgi:uncharacterized protein (TIGR02677 family)